MLNNKSNKNSTVFFRVLKTVANYKFLIILSLIFSVASVVLSLYIPVLAGRAIDNISYSGNVNFNKIKGCLFQILFCAVVTGLLQWLINVINNKIAYNTVRDIRGKAFEKIQILPISYIDTHSYGDIVSRIITDAEQFVDGLVLGFSQFFIGIVTIIVTLVFMLLINPLIALVVVVLTPISLFVAKFIATRTYDMFRLQSEIRGEQTAVINETVQNQKVVKAFSYTEKSSIKFNEINEKLGKCSLKATFYSSLTNPVTRFINNLIYAAVGFSGGMAAIKGMMTVGGFVSFLVYANQYTKPFNEISGVITELQNALACVGRLFEIIDTEPEIPDNENVKELESVRGEVSFKNVSFSYNVKKPLLKNINLNIKAGSKVAIVGPTGCGKTTLINLLMRFYDVNSGEICVDGINIKEISRKSLRENFGMVLQDTWLTNATVRDNIAFGNDNATEEEIIAAAKATHAHSFIKRMRNGYNTVICEDENSFSEGERQLISIARVMLKSPPLLILDEATSSIDTRTELKVQDAFSKLMQGRTCFIVAHRLSTIIDADLILVMKDGQIIEQGSHSELMKQNGFYTNLFNSQFAV